MKPKGGRSRLQLLHGNTQQPKEQNKVYEKNPQGNRVTQEWFSLLIQVESSRPCWAVGIPGCGSQEALSCGLEGNFRWWEREQESCWRAAPGYPRSLRWKGLWWCNQTLTSQAPGRKVMVSIRRERGGSSINTYTGVLIFNSWDQKIFKAEVS